MSAPDRWVVLGLAHVRSAWFADVAGWATAAVLPIDFVKCLSAEEVRSRITSGRAFSALIIDAALTALDRDLIDEATSAGCSVVVVDAARSGPAWTDIGASATLHPDFDPGALLDVLAAHAPLISQVDRSIVVAPSPALTMVWRGRLITVMGAGGAGTSTVAMALAAGFGDDPRNRNLVLLADLALHGDQAVLHHVGDIVPGLQELVDAHRLSSPGPDELRALTFQPKQASYSLLLGLRRHIDWAVLRPRAVDAALDSLRRTFSVTVADVDSDLEGDDRTGNAALANRNLLARTAVRDADVVLVVALPTVTGVHRLVRLTRDVIDHGVAAERIVPVVNCAPRNPAARSEIMAALAKLGPRSSEAPIQPVVFVPERRKVAKEQRDAVAIGSSFTRTVSDPIQAVLDRIADHPGKATSLAPQRIVPGSLGSWADEEDVAG